MTASLAALLILPVVLALYAPLDCEWVDHTEQGHRFVGITRGHRGILLSGRQVMFYGTRIRPLSIGLPLEWPHIVDDVVRVRVGFGPFSLTWERYRDSP